MKTQHTPGPWRVNGRSIDATDVCVATIETIYRAPAGSYYDRAYVAETEANARLIAAAPELLDALRAVLASLPEDVPTYDHARALLTRIERIAS